MLCSKTMITDYHERREWRCESTAYVQGRKGTSTFLSQMKNQRTKKRRKKKNVLLVENEKRIVDLRSIDHASERRDNLPLPLSLWSYTATTATARNSNQSVARWRRRTTFRDTIATAKHAEWGAERGRLISRHHRRRQWCGGGCEWFYGGGFSW